MFSLASVGGLFNNSLRFERHMFTSYVNALHNVVVRGAKTVKPAERNLVVDDYTG